MRRTLAHIRALLALVELSGFLILPAAATDAHVLGAPPTAVAVDEHHHHHGGEGPASDLDQGDPASHSDGDGGHTHMPSPVANMDARTPQIAAPALFAEDVRLAPRSDDSFMGWLTAPRKRPPRSS